ncbi:cellulose binding domain-containing protein, partial [Plantactinospora sp. ZYX-F-223]|uniref:cellulose binding domain-containing protein n=1 Tax=Plantactinospora sp. ZYX-F-223 TaxID=3144103 RepID=UPI0031FBCF40
IPSSVRRCSTAVAALALAVTAGLVAPATPARAAVACEVDFTATTWTGGSLGNARIRNLGDLPWNSVLVEFTLPDNHQLMSSWNYTVQVLGQNVRAQSMSGVAPVPAGGTTAFGFVARYTGTYQPPSNWRVNGATCSVPGQPPAVLADPAERTVAEGGSASFTVRLSHPPTESVYVRMTIDGTGVWAFPPMLITFTPTDWSTPKSYSGYSTQDADAVDDVAVITLAVPGYLSDKVTLSQLDDD